MKQGIEQNVNEKVVIQLGKNGYSDNFISELEEQLQKHNVIKLRVLKNAPFDDRNQAFDFLKKNLPKDIKILEIKGWTAILKKIR